MKRCPFCAEQIPSEAHTCVWCRESLDAETPIGEPTPVLNVSTPDALKAESLNDGGQDETILTSARIMTLARQFVASLGKLSTRAGRLSALYVLGGVVLMLSPLFPGLLFTMVPATSPQDWSRTVAVPYFQSILPLLLPLAGLALVVVGTRWPESRKPGLRRAVAFLMGTTGAVAGAWSASSLNRFGSLVTSDFSDLTFLRTIHFTFKLVAPWVVIVVGAWIALAISQGLSRRVPSVILFLSLVALGGVLGAVVGPLPPGEALIQRASTAVAEAEASFRGQTSREWRAANSGGSAAPGEPCQGIRRGDVCVDQTLCQLIIGLSGLIPVANDPATYASRVLGAMNLLGSDRSRQMGAAAVQGVLRAGSAGGQVGARNAATSYTLSLCSDAQFFRDVAMTYPG